MIITFIYKNMQSTAFPSENNLHSIYLYLLKFCVLPWHHRGDVSEDETRAELIKWH